MLELEGTSAAIPVTSRSYSSLYRIDLPDRIVPSKIFLSCLLRKDNSKWPGQHGTWFTPYQPETKEIKEMAVGKKKILDAPKSERPAVPAFAD